MMRDDDDGDDDGRQPEITDEPLTDEEGRELMAEIEDRLRRERPNIDLFRTYRLPMPDGSVEERTGADLIAGAEAMASLVRTLFRDDDPQVIRVALERLKRLQQPGGDE
jgi:hypothetical protein